MRIPTAAPLNRDRTGPVAPAPAAAPPPLSLKPPSRLARRFAAALAEADIRVNGSRRWDIQVHNDRLYRRVFLWGLTGLGDAYVDGWWDCEAIDLFFEKTLRAGLNRRFRFTLDSILSAARIALVNSQRRPRAARDIRSHYDRGSDLFGAMLDPRMVYSCGYWRDATTLEQAQEHKLELICRKVGVDQRRGLRVLDIGCGWGGFCAYAAERHGARTVGVTLSEDQARIAKERCRGLDAQIRLQDWRDVRDGVFDRIVSIGMFEHVGPKNYRAYFQAAHRCLADDGLFLLHCFATSRGFPNLSAPEVNWVERHIFPGMVVPSLAQIGRGIDGRFVVEDLHNFGPDYAPTLLAWHANFERAWPTLAARYDERFHRLWRYYLLICAAAFRARAYQLWQFVLSPGGVPGGYEAVRSAVQGGHTGSKPRRGGIR